MAEITINIPDDKQARVVAGFCKHHGYEAELEDGTANPEGKGAFMRRKFIEMVKRDVRYGELTLQKEAAEAIETVDIT